MNNKDPFKSVLLTFGRIELFKIALKDVLVGLLCTIGMVLFLIGGIGANDQWVVAMSAVIVILLLVAIVMLIPSFLFSMLTGILFNVFIKTKNAIGAGITMLIYTGITFISNLTHLGKMCVSILSFINAYAQSNEESEILVKYVYGGATVGYVIAILFVGAVSLIFLALHIMMIVKLFKMDKQTFLSEGAQ